MPIDRDQSAPVVLPLDEVPLAAVNGWRGPGALAIAMAHLGVATDFIEIRHLEPIALIVDLFFVLSGILIAKAYTDKLSSASAIPDYIIRRFGRIWPVQAATLALLVGYELSKLALQTFAGLSFSAPPFSTDGIALFRAIPTNLLLIHSLGIHDRETWNFPSWSLSVEFATYAIFAAFCLVTPILRRTLAATTIMASIAILIVVAPHHMRSTFDYGIFRCLAGFFAGTLCYDAARRWRLPRWPFPTLVEIAAVALFGLWLSLSVHTYAAFAAPFADCLFILAFIPQRGLLSRALLTKPLQFMAELSFTIYMVHALVLVLLLGALHEWTRLFGAHLFVLVSNPIAGLPGANPFISVVHIDGIVWKLFIATIYVVVVLIASLLTYRMVERPGRTFFNGLAKRVGANDARARRIDARPRSVSPTHGRPSDQLGSAP